MAPQLRPQGMDEGGWHCMLRAQYGVRACVSEHMTAALTGRLRRQRWRRLGLSSGRTKRPALLRRCSTLHAMCSYDIARLAWQGLMSGHVPQVPDSHDSAVQKAVRSQRRAEVACVHPTHFSQACQVDWECCEATWSTWDMTVRSCRNCWRCSGPGPAHWQLRSPS